MQQTTRRKFTGDTLVLATNNRGKIPEIQRLLEPYGITVKCMADFGIPSPDETGTTYE